LPDYKRAMAFAHVLAAVRGKDDLDERDVDRLAEELRARFVEPRN
jgi:hypothetical protein